MGLRINTNLSALTALRTMKVNNRAMRSSLERLATGLRINRAADDPSGLVISEELRAQLSGLKQATENTEYAINIFNTADASLQEIQNLLVDIQESITFAMNQGAITPAQLAAEQDAVDFAIQAIDRVASTSRYGDLPLLNGVHDVNLVSDRPDELNDLKVRSVLFQMGEAQKTLSVTVLTLPERGEIYISNVSVAATAAVTIRISGPRGTVDIVVAAGANGSGIAMGINSVAGFTGIYASGAIDPSGNSILTIRTEDFGTEQSVRIEVIEGSINGTAYIDGVAEAGPFDAGEILYDTGADGEVQFAGQTFGGVGKYFKILTRVATLEFELDPDLIDDGTITVGSTYSFTVANTGFAFQLKEKPMPTDKLSAGIEGVFAAGLGMEPINDIIGMAIAGGTGPAYSATIQKGGFLTTIQTGGDNDLFTNPENAAIIISSAVKQVSRLRGFLGALVADNLTPNLVEIEIEHENLNASLSTLRDLDFAHELSEFMRTQILFQSNLSTLASANLAPQGVLALLGGV